jgi:hypothetical protein
VLDRLTAADFAPVVGQSFAIVAENGDRVDLKLVAARAHDPDAPPADESGARSPFTLEFLGPAQPVLPQHIYRLEHPDFDPLEIFIVPVGGDEGGTTYEAIFA